MRKLFPILIVITLFILSCSNNNTVIKLKCEYLDNPLALSVKQPHFSWMLNSKEKNIIQQSYKIIVWNEEGEQWNSGKIISDISVGIKYLGKVLESKKTYEWKVTVWDNYGKVHESENAFFETGLMTIIDWKAKWIGMKDNQVDTLKYNLDKIYWVWYPEANSNKDQPQGIRFFKYNTSKINLDEIEKAFFIASADDACTLFVNNQKVGTSGWLKNKEFDVLSELKNGSNLLEFKAENKWGGAGLIGQLFLRYKNGENHYFSTNSKWQVSKDSIHWVNAKALAKSGEGEGLRWLDEKMYFSEKIKPASYFRKEFSAKKSITEAKLYVTSLGVYEFNINGKRVGDSYLTPGWTDYNKRILYQAYNVKAFLNKGENIIGAILGDGWYTGTIGWGHKRNNYGKYPLWLLAQLEITYSDGSKETILTDQSWKTTSGPILFSDLLDGEIYDATKELINWNTSNFNDQDWHDVIVKDITENIKADQGPPVKVVREISPLNIFKSNNEEYIVDFGQNMVGWVELKVAGNKGDTIKIKHAEMLTEDKTLYTKNLRSAKATDIYILKEGNEILHPYFTFHGFRYISIRGCKEQPSIEDIKGKVLQSNTPKTGSFECSNELVNKIYNNAVWGQRGNFISIPTDCPQRDERLGWMGDAQVFVKTASYNMDVCSFFNKWMYDVVDAQAEDGGFSDVSPRIIDMSNGAPAWGDAGVIVPWTIYNMYGNKEILESHYESYIAWVEYIYKSNPNFLWKNNCKSNFGDWLNTDAVTDRGVLATAFFAYSTGIVSKIAKVLNKQKDVVKYQKLFNNIANAFVHEYVDKDGKIRGNTQTAYVLALKFNLLPDSLKTKAAAYLVADIKSRNMHHSTGFIGIGHLLPVLTKYGYNEIAYKMITNNTFPSLGYMVENGATTIWERWDGWTKEKGFQSPGMNSFNHYSLGSPTEWLYTHVLGIQSVKPGFKEFEIAPHPGGGLEWAKGSFNSVYGKIVSDWKIENNTLTLKVEIPANTTADIVFPGADVESTVKSTKVKNGNTIFKIASGEYTFKGILK